MSFQFSEKSKLRLETCHPDLQRLFNEVIKHYDCTVLCGHRDKKEQDDAFEGGFSKVKWPHSKHNSFPSMAVDVIPVKCDWRDREKFVHFAGFVSGIAKSLGIEIRCGIDFNEDLNFRNDSLFDGVHFECKQKPNLASLF